MIKRLTPETLKCLLDMYNKIWKKEKYLLKEEQGSKNIRSYRSVAQRNILCKIFESITKKETGLVLVKNNNKFFDIFRRRENTAAILFDIKKAYDKVNREKTLEQLENMRIQEE